MILDTFQCINFHTHMSHLAAIGHILTNSGFHESLVAVYISNVVIHILRGKAIFTRYLQGYILVCFEDLRINKKKSKNKY